MIAVYPVFFLLCAMFFMGEWVCSDKEHHLVLQKKSTPTIHSVYYYQLGLSVLSDLLVNVAFLYEFVQSNWEIVWTWIAYCLRMCKY